MELKAKRRQKRKLRVRGKVEGTQSRPRLTVTRTNQHIYAQVIDDVLGKTLVSASDMAVKNGTNTEKAKQVGLEISKLAAAKKIDKIVFDRNGYQYHGRVKAVADGAREGGLNF
jgi:large subunit ribosomal protein L18